MISYDDSQIGALDEGEGEERGEGMASADQWLLEYAVKDFESRIPCPLTARQVHSPNAIHTCMYVCMYVFTCMYVCYELLVMNHCCLCVDSNHVTMHLKPYISLNFHVMSSKKLHYRKYIPVLQFQVQQLCCTLVSYLLCYPQLVNCCRC